MAEQLQVLVRRRIIPGKALGRYPAIITQVAADTLTAAARPIRKLTASLQERAREIGPHMLAA